MKKKKLQNKFVCILCNIGGVVFLCYIGECMVCSYLMFTSLHFTSLGMYGLYGMYGMYGTYGMYGMYGLYGGDDDDRFSVGSFWWYYIYRY